MQILNPHLPTCNVWSPHPHGHFNFSRQITISPYKWAIPSHHCYPASSRKETLKFGVCADLIGLVNVVVGSPPTFPCFSPTQGLANAEAAVCLCTATKADTLGINLNISVSLTWLLNTYVAPTIRWIPAALSNVTLRHPKSTYPTHSHAAVLSIKSH
ncbi:proline-rich protein DC2.15-like protein [Cinnamomum micranthum f. kanehirae]|uniref:Proline-rich protein DC2.15-like protein n=1 Tax=Cinnamomum micranthum f. kanehirae TaxID=337451 RepID=A0A443P9M6_9MAGN|nr:proline-rich protein DC2.15-like protein [Cinnamomum micranthum f. kanehirae]